MTYIGRHTLTHLMSASLLYFNFNSLECTNSSNSINVIIALPIEAKHIVTKYGKITPNSVLYNMKSFFISIFSP